MQRQPRVITQIGQSASAMTEPRRVLVPRQRSKTQNNKECFLSGATAPLVCFSKPRLLVDKTTGSLKTAQEPHGPHVTYT